MHSSRIRGALWTLSAIVALAMFSVISASPASAQSDTTGTSATDMQCQSDATIASLRLCVQHAWIQGFIDNQGVTKSLLAELDAAQHAVDRQQPGVAVQVLWAFIHEVQAQSGKQIDPTHAQHMIAHAQMVIQALQAPSAT